MLLALLTIGDIALLAYLRRRRSRRVKTDRMMDSLRRAIKLELASAPTRLRLRRTGQLKGWGLIPRPPVPSR
jgi:hypothetical protein